MNVWTEHRNPEGRTYWFNTGTRESVWEKPDELKSPFERALNQTKWKEYFSGGRKYYYNTETKESKWDMPDELLLVLEKVEKEKAPPLAAVPGAITAPGFIPVGSATPASASSEIATNGVVGAHTGALPLASATVLPARPNMPEDPVIPHNGFATIEEGEKAFTHLLRKAGVDPSWTWDQTMRAIITDPLYKALNTLAEKKAVFEKYTTNLKVKEQEEKEARLAKLRPAIRNMLKGNPNVFHYSTFNTADKLFSQHPIWQQAKIESERKLIFEEYVAELKQREVQESRAARSRSVAKVVNLFKQLDVDVLTRWRQAHNLILESDEWNSDPELRKLPTLDILLAFEDYSRVREREYEEQTRRAQVEKTRKERKAREAFKELLQSLVASGDIKARSKWKNVYPKFKDDDRYINMLGNPGSNQIELFWDVVDALDQKLDAKIAVVTNAIAKMDGPSKAESKEENGAQENSGFSVTPTTTEEEFLNVIKATKDEDVKSMTEEELHLIFSTLHDAAVKRQADEKRRAERKQRHLQEDLRYALRKLPEPIDLNLSYEEAVPLMENLTEFQAIDGEENRRAAFAKFVKRQKERLREAAGSEDGGSTTSRKRKEPSRPEHSHERERGDRERRDRDRDRERERDRDRESSYRERERERGRDYDSRTSRHYRHDDYDRDRRSSKDYDRDYRSSKHHEKDDRRRERERGASRRSEYQSRDWDDRREEREKSVSSSTYRDRDEPPKSEKRELDELPLDDRAEKRPRYSEPAPTPSGASAREDTPEEGEI
ncbi:hypothetical protein F5878DRAFT_617261 [Lentinula raphanica]|uniref:Formin binding protein n=1 Tax=Lentinula raphanica TaxID=153919 RepID=A0AA38PA79_9AGAR|nr:hypothetical protein C8R42DRAFT_696535 [Lentinula raphanica]KAJ3828347.1 hypothetical protein F5880DRAFT_1670341 [Lentinula raphanica]KAJ3839198.1 hypothetical protein F5878DRAFT_617261 [Lentinula raphanica]